MISAFILCTSDLGGSGDEDQDHSLLFAFTPDGAAKASTTTLKGLGLAVRGALESICGEKTRILRLRQQQHGEITAAFTHLQVCMVVLTLPGHLPDAIACSLVLQLAQSMVLLAGPSTLWTELHHEPSGSSYAKIRGPLRPLFGRLCEGVQRQVSGPGWARGLPACVLQPGILCMQLPGDRHQELDTLLRAHETSGVLGLATQTIQPPSQMQYNFYSRCCCLMYRGLTVWSGMTPADTRLTWHLCWTLGVHGQAQALPCQVTMHRVYLTAPQPHAAAVDTQPGAAAAAEQHVALGQQHPTSLLILVSACHMVLAVTLTSYDEDIEELAGQVEAHAAVELLAKVHNAFMQDLQHASASSALLAAVSRAPPDVPSSGAGALSPDSLSSGRGHGGGAGGRPRTPSHHNSLFMRILARSRPGAGKGLKAGDAAGTAAAGDAGHAGRLAVAGLGVARSWHDPHSPPSISVASPKSAPPPTPTPAGASPSPTGRGPATIGSDSPAHSPPLPGVLTTSRSRSGRESQPIDSACAAPSAATVGRPGTENEGAAVGSGLHSASSPHTAALGPASLASPLSSSSPLVSPSYQPRGPGPGSSRNPSPSPSPSYLHGTTPEAHNRSVGGVSGVDSITDGSSGPQGGMPSSPTTLIYSRGSGRAAGRGETGATAGAGFGSGFDMEAAPNPDATHAVLLYDADSGRITTLGDVPHVGMVPEVWDTVALCRAMLGNSSVAVSAPPKHSRLCMTLQQIEQLSATRSQREGGQRLGSADATPWQYHPEVAGLATVQQVTRKLRTARQLLATPWFVTAYKHADGHETYIIHLDDVDEAAVMQEVAGHRIGADARPQSGLVTSPPQSQSQIVLQSPQALQQQQQQQQLGRPGAAKNLIFA